MSEVTVPYTPLMEALSAAAAKETAAAERPKAPIFRADMALADQARAITSRDQLEKEATNGLLLKLTRERAHRSEIRKLQEEIVIAQRDALAFEESRLADQDAAIAAIDVLIAGLDRSAI